MIIFGLASALIVVGIFATVLIIGVLIWSIHTSAEPNEGKYHESLGGWGMG